MFFSLFVHNFKYNSHFFSFQRSYFLAIVCLAISVPPSLAADAPLTLAAAQQRAIERSRQLVAQDYAVTASREMAVSAGQLPDPVLKVGIDNLPVNGSDRYSTTSDFMTMRRIGVTQEITRSNKRKLRADRYEHEAEKAIAEKDQKTAEIERDTALAWLDLYYAEAMSAVIAEQSEQAKLGVQAAFGSYRAGRGSQAELFAARSSLAIFNDRASDAARRVRNAKVMLARWIGDMDGLNLADKPATDTIRLDPETLDTTLAYHPEIAVLSKQEEIAQTEAKLAEANKEADWSVEFGYQQRGPAYSNMVSIGVSIPLELGQKNLQDRELSAKLAAVEQVKAEREEMLREHVAVTRIQIQEWQNNRERITRYQQELIPLAYERTTATLAAYRGGKSSLLETLTARSNEIDIRLQSLQLEADTDRLWAQLNFLTPTNSTAKFSKNVNKDSK